VSMHLNYMKSQHERLGFFNIRLEQRINEIGLSTAQVAKEARMTYEHVRKLLLGESLPSDSALARLCGVLRLSRRDMKQRVARDRMIFKFGDAAWANWGVTPRIGQLEIICSVANEEQQEFMRLWIIAFCEAKKRQQANSNVNKN
jgi:transcriptional regulator with XRE-family HTH domain